MLPTLLSCKKSELAASLSGLGHLTLRAQCNFETARSDYQNSKELASVLKRKLISSVSMGKGQRMRVIFIYQKESRHIKWTGLAKQYTKKMEFRPIGEDTANQLQVHLFFFPQSVNISLTSTVCSTSLRQIKNQNISLQRRLPQTDTSVYGYV